MFEWIFKQSIKFSEKRLQSLENWGKKDSENANLICLWLPVFKFLTGCITCAFST